MQYHPRPFQLTTLLLFSVLCVSLSGCPTYVVGKTYLDRQRAPIYVTENEKEIAECDFVKQVTANTSWGGLALQDEALERVISDITHDASEAGANVLLIRNKSKEFMGSSASGEAYHCKNIPLSP